MLNNFGGDAREIVRHAQDAARELGQPFIGSEHLLLGLMRDGVEDPATTTLRRHGVTPELVRNEIRRWGATDRLDSDDADALQMIGIDLDAVRTVVEGAFGPGSLDEPPARSAPRGLRAVLGRREPAIKGHLPLTRNARKVLELALREAIHLGGSSVEAAHILLGLLRSRAGSEMRILTANGIDPDALHEEVVIALRDVA